MIVTVKYLFSKLKHLGIQIFQPIIIGEIPHHPPAFTQGLCFKRGVLYESCGLYGHSCLKQINIKTGNIVKVHKVTDSFAEGIGCIGNRLIQLTWKSGVAFEYCLPDLKIISKKNYSGEGWGMTEKENRFIVTNGSSFITYYDEEFNAIQQKKIRLNNLPLKNMNDLALRDNHLYINVFYSDFIYQVNEKSGKVTALFDCSQLKTLGGYPSRESVLNGIAYDPELDIFFITGKNWRKIFKVKLNSDPD